MADPRNKRGSIASKIRLRRRKESKVSKEPRSKSADFSIVIILS